MEKRKNRPAGISEKVIRILQMYTLISQNGYPSIDDLAVRLEVTPRTVYRYLEIISMIDPIEFDKHRKGYRFAGTERIRKLTLSEDELLLLLALGETVTHLGRPLQERFREFMGRLMNAHRQGSGASGPPIVVRIPDAIEGQHFEEHFRMISDGMRDKRSLEMAYLTRGSTEKKHRRVDPYGLVFHEGAWILIGYCHLREDVRRFALDRIQELKMSNFVFLPRDDYDLAEDLSHSWGVYDEKDVTVKVRFAAEISDLIARKKRWHPSGQREVLPSGELVLTFTVAGVREIKKWIYSWLPHVEVLEPEWFRQCVREELNAAQQAHKPGGHQ